MPDRQLTGEDLRRMLRVDDEVYMAQLAKDLASFRSEYGDDAADTVIAALRCGLVKPLGLKERRT